MAGRGGVRSALAPAVKTMLLKSGACSALRRVAPSRGLAILRYHAICERGADYADPSICISPSAFARHVEYLAARYAVLSLPDAVDALQRGRSLPSNAVALTFDDGYADNLEAARRLAKRGLTATFYITAGCLAGGEPFWPAELRTLVRSIDAPQVELRVNGSALTLPLATEQDRGVAVSRLTRVFKSHPIPVRERVREELRSLAHLGRRSASREGGPASYQRVMLTWEEVAEMQRLGMTIGAHTLTHPNLPSAGLEDAAREIAGSKERLERELGGRVTMFSYPNGGAEIYYTPELQAIVRNAGFEGAATSRNGVAGPASDPFALERVQVYERLEDLVFALEVERFAFKPTSREHQKQVWH